MSMTLHPLDKNGYLGSSVFDAEVVENYGHAICFNVFCNTAYSEKGEKLERELYITGYIKFDGCTEINYGTREGDRQSGDLYFGGIRDFKNHFEMIRSLYELAFKEMEREIPDKEQW